MALLIRLPWRVVKGLDGRKYLLIPHFLRDAYKTGYARTSFEGIVIQVEYLGKRDNVLYFLVTVDYFLSKKLEMRLKQVYGAELEVHHVTLSYVRTL